MSAFHALGRLGYMACPVGSHGSRETWTIGWSVAIIFEVLRMAAVVIDEAARTPANSLPII
jgi:hypothetical protein